MLRTGWVVVRRMTRVSPSANSMARVVSETSTVTVKCLVRPVGVVLLDPGIDRGLSLGHRGERAGDGQEVGAEGAVEALHLPVLVR